MRFKNYALTLVMALGLGTAGYAQSDWGVPGGHIHASEARYVTSATTSGAVEDLSYTNSSKPSTVFIDTNESFTVEQGQTFQLHVTTSNEMKWNHGVIYVDWNGDKDFDDEGELITKVGYDSNDDGVPSGFSGTGNPSIVDFTQDITVPESATAGETRLRLQFQDAWHGSSNNDGHQDLGKNHPHNAMDDIDNGGCYDFVMNINAAVVEPAGYTTLVIGEHANGQITVADSKGVSYEDGDQMPWGETITATFTPDAGYVLQTAYWNNIDLADMGLENNQWSIGVSENIESMEFSAVFVEDAVEPVGEWVEIYNEPLAWASKAGATGQTVMTCSSNFGVMRADIMSGLPYSYYCWGGTSSDYFYVTVDVPEDGTYKFSYLVKYELYSGYDGSINLNFISGENDSYETVGEAVPVEGGFEVELSKLESPEMQLTAGTHVFGIKYAENDMNDGTLYFADFRLYQLQAGEPVPTLYPVTFTAPENGTLAVMNGDVAVNSGDEVAAGTELVITAEPADGYVLETLTVNGADFVSGETYTTGEEETVIAATFAAAPVSNLTAINLPKGTGSTHTLFVFDEDDYGQGNSNNFYNGRSGNLTMSVWVNIHEAEGMLLGYGQQWFGPEGVFNVAFSDGKYTLRNRTSTADHTACADPDEYTTISQDVELDTWAFITVVYDTDNMKRYMYYNGEVVFDEAIGGHGLGLLPDDCVFYVGNPRSTGSWSSPYASGNLDLDEVQLWNRALSADEVKASMTEVDPAAEGLLALYRFGEDRMSSDNTFANLAEAGTVAAKVLSGYGGSYLPSSAVAPTFVEGHPAVEEPEPEPGEGGWVSVYSNDLSGTTADEVDVANAKKFSSSGNSTTMVVKEAQADGAVLEGQKFGTALDFAMAHEAFWVEVNVEEAGKYKFSYRGRMEGDGTMVAELRYGATTSMPVDLTPVSGTYSFTASTVLPGALMESYELDLEAGTYAFCVYLTDATNGAVSSSNFFIGDFNLYKYEEGAVPTTYTVTWAAPENGTLAVTAADEALTSPATVEEGTEIVITATPSEGYELETLTVGGADFTNGETYTVNGNVEIVATFAAVVVENPWGEPTGTTASISTKDDKDRYVTSVSTTGATEDLTYTNDVNYAMNNQVYINTGSSMTVEQGQTIELHVTASDDMIWCHGIVFVDWNGDYDFDDEGELIQKVGLDHEDDGAGQSFYLTGNTVMKDFTVTIEVPADATIGDTRLRLQFQDAWHAGNGHKGHAHTAMDEIDKGGVYDFDMTILEGTAPTDALITVEAENCTVRVRDFTSFEDYESGTRVPLGTQLLVSATANDGYTNATFTINGKEWNHYTAWVVEEDVHIVATAEEEQSCVINYTFDGEGLGSMTVYDVSGFSMTEVENGGSVAIGGTINVYVEMNENVNGTITINNGEPEAFDYATWEGVYTQRIKIEEGMETLDIAVKLEQGEAPAMYNVGFSITNAELADEYSFTDDNYNELVVGTNQVAEGAQLGLMVLFESNEDVSGVVKVDGEIVDEFDFESCQGMYIGTVVESVDRDLKVEVELTDGNGLGDNFVDGLAVYPTVFIESVNVAMPAAGTVTVYDMAGAAVYTTEAEEGVNVLNLGNLDNGLFLIKVEGESTAKTFQVLKK